jgi:hypothetical protein
MAKGGNVLSVMALIPALVVKIWTKRTQSATENLSKILLINQSEAEVTFIMSTY